MTDLSDLGEFGFIKKLKEKFGTNLPEGVEGIGDDCAVIPQSDSYSLLVTTDMLIENIHFLRKDISPKNLGYKSLAVNLSDIAAMGGLPEYAFLSVAFPANLNTAWLEEFAVGFQELANKYNVLLLGGDTNKSSNDIVVSVTVIGRVKNEFLKKRSAAQLGDVICVTDFLGDSAAGLQAILESLPRDSEIDYLIDRHYKPKPAVEEGLWLSEHPSVHAMMDVSDGIDSDLKRIMENSDCGVIVQVENIPISSTLEKMSRDYNFNSVVKAITGGEDYCLLLTIESSSFEQLKAQFQEKFGRPLYRIGTVTTKDNGLVYRDKGTALKMNANGYDHFKKR